MIDVTPERAEDCYITPAMDAHGDPEKRCDTHDRVVVGDEPYCDGYPA